MNIQEVKFQFVRNLTSRNSTKYIVVHHTASTSNLTVHDIHRLHLNEDYAGIGYHYYIDKSGNIFTGRPVWAVGSHALPINSISVAVCISGNFEIEKPNTLQLKSLREIISYLQKQYPNAKLISHSQVIETEECKKEAKDTGNPLSYYATACCGKNLIKELPSLKEKEKIKLWVQNHKVRAVVNGKWYSCKLDKDINLGELHLIEE